jgi:hypothetical protein
LRSFAAFLREIFFSAVGGFSNNAMPAEPAACDAAAKPSE